MGRRYVKDAILRPILGEHTTGVLRLRCRIDYEFSTETLGRIDLH